jgi:hypothetical protein
MAKLTLNVDPKDVAAAKAYAREHRTSLSKLVAAYLRSLTGASHGGDPVIRKLHEQLLAGGYKPSRRSLDELRRRHLDRKYR